MKKKLNAILFSLASLSVGMWSNVSYSSGNEINVEVIPSKQGQLLLSINEKEKTILISFDDKENNLTLSKRDMLALVNYDEDGNNLETIPLNNKDSFNLCELSAVLKKAIDLELVTPDYRYVILPNVNHSVLHNISNCNDYKLII